MKTKLEKIGKYSEMLCRCKIKHILEKTRESAKYVVLKDGSIFGLLGGDGYIYAIPEESEKEEYLREMGKLESIAWQPPRHRTSYETELVSDGMTAGTRNVCRQVYHDMNGRLADR